MGRVAFWLNRLFLQLRAAHWRRTDLATRSQRHWEWFGNQPTQRGYALMDWEQRFYASALHDNDELLLIGCGSGRDLVALLRQGHSVDGVEPAPGCVALAKQALRDHHLQAQIFPDPIETHTFGKRYDAAIFSWCTYCYLVSSNDRISVLQRLRRALKPSGRILLSYVVRAPSPTPGGMRLTRWLGPLLRSDIAWEIGARVATHHRLPFFERTFLPSEIAAEVQQAGLRIEFHQEAEKGLGVLLATARAGCGEESQNRHRHRALLEPITSIL